MNANPPISPSSSAQAVPAAILDANASAVSWSAIFAGAAAAASLSLVLMLLGGGLGLAAVSPWSGEGAGASMIGGSAIVWMTFTQLAAAAIGGYLAGRLRTRWRGIHSDEVYFRDTAHGFLAWSVATVAAAALLTTSVGGAVSSTAKVTAAVAGPAIAGAGTATVAAATGTGPSDDAEGRNAPMGYLIDTLFRPDATATAPASASPDAAAAPVEVARIYANALATGELEAQDADYVARLVAQRTGLDPASARKRVDDNFTALRARVDQFDAQVKGAADQARKAASYTSIWTVLSLFVGAFVASFCAIYGGRRRDS